MENSHYPGAGAILHIMGIQPGEKVLILSDENTSEDPLHILQVTIADHGAYPIMHRALPSTFQEDLPSSIGHLILEADVIIFAASQSFYHTTVRKKAKHLWKKRVAECYGLVKDTFAGGGLTADYHEVARVGKELSMTFNDAKSIRVTSEAGTDLTCRIKNVGVEDGRYQAPGSGGNLPAGEVFIIPEPGTAHGRVIFDLSMDLLGSFHEAVAGVTIEDGEIKEVFGANASILENAIEHDRRIVHVAEIAFGTNAWAKIGRNVLEDEKKYGTGHIGLGNDTYFGGGNGGPHLDGVFLNPVVILEGVKEIRLVMKS